LHWISQKIVQSVQSFDQLRMSGKNKSAHGEPVEPSVQASTPDQVRGRLSFLPRDTGADEGGGLNGLNDLNCLNQKKHCYPVTPVPQSLRG
jgi:hypothetical protein